MDLQFNSNYLENYANEYSDIVCDRYFADKQFITGQDILELTNAVQVNFFVVKRLFDLWKAEIEKLNSSPFFDYRDVAVHGMLTQLVNLLSRRIRVEERYFKPLLRDAVTSAIKVATDPLGFYKSEIDFAPEHRLDEYLRENKKYYKWNQELIAPLIDKAGIGREKDDYKNAIDELFLQNRNDLQSVNLLLATLGDVKVFDLDFYQSSSVENEYATNINIGIEGSSFFDSIHEEDELPGKGISGEISDSKTVSASPVHARGGKELTESEIRARFSIENYPGLKGRIEKLPEAITINQRFMFRKELFEGSDDLMNYALNTIEDCQNIDKALDFINSRLLNEMDWAMDSEAVEEFLLLIYRRFLA